MSDAFDRLCEELGPHPSGHSPARMPPALVKRHWLYRRPSDGDAYVQMRVSRASRSTLGLLTLHDGRAWVRLSFGGGAPSQRRADLRAIDLLMATLAELRRDLASTDGAPAGEMHKLAEVVDTTVRWVVNTDLRGEASSLWTLLHLAEEAGALPRGEAHMTDRPDAGEENERR